MLVVEDEPAIAETILYALETAGYDVVHAGTGTEGLGIFAARAPGFVILDVGLPDRSGFDVCREIRRSSEVPVLFLTAREHEIDRVLDEIVTHVHRAVTGRSPARSMHQERS